MRQNFIFKHSRFVIITLAVLMSFAFSDGSLASNSDTTYLHLFKSKASKSSFKNSLHLVMPPMRPAVISTTKLNVAKSDDKLLTNVSVYPNPVTGDQINLKYELSRYSNVTIKILDVLGNDIITLYSQRIDAGEKSFSYSLNSKLNKGFYFIRIVAGTESVIKRISVL